MSTDRNINGLHNYLRGLAVRRNSNSVTADDAARWLDRKGIDNVETRLSITNAVLNNHSTTFEGTGYTRSERASRRGGRIREWSYTG